MMHKFAFLNNLPLLAQFLDNLLEKDYTIDLTQYLATIEFKLPQNSITLQEILHFYQYCEQQDFIRMHSSRNWTDEEWKVLIWITLQYCNTHRKSHELLTLRDWPVIAATLAFKDAPNCNFKWQTHLKASQSNKTWTTEEDQLLFQVLSQNAALKWFEVQYEMFVQSDCRYFRKAKQYRERWNNYLNPSVNRYQVLPKKRGIWTEVDDIQLLEIAISEGLRWSNIAKKMRNRTENQVKNRFKSLMNKERKILQMKEPSLSSSNLEQKHGIDSQTEKLIHSILNRLRPLQKANRPVIQQQQHQTQQMVHQQQPMPQLQQIPALHKPQPLAVQPQTQFVPEYQSYQQFMLSQNPYYLPPQMPVPPLPMQPPAPMQPLPMGFYPQYIPKAYEMYPFMQQPPVQQLSIAARLAQLSTSSEKLIKDSIKQEDGSSDKSNQAQEPRPYKNICVSQQVSARSSANGSTSSVHSIDLIKTNFQNLQIDSEAGSPELQQEKSRKKKRSSSGAFEISNAGQIKTKRSRFFYQSNMG